VLRHKCYFKINCIFANINATLYILNNQLKLTSARHVLGIFGCPVIARVTTALRKAIVWCHAMVWARLATFISCRMLVFTWRANLRKEKQITC
jgi:hypothetical protein